MRKNKKLRFGTNCSNETNSYILNKVTLPDGTIFYCNNKLLEDIDREILKEIKNEKQFNINQIKKNKL